MPWVVIDRPTVKLYKPYYQIFKRLLDITLCIPVLIIFLPFAIVISTAIRLDSPGPILFVQKRVGKGGRLFDIYKFRTLYHNIDKSSHQAFMKDFVQGKVQQKGNNPIFKPFKDSQVTRVGRFLRDSSLDELPQLLNVLKGDMSLVGPRPNVPWEVEEYLEWHKERLEVLPGITGLAQVRGRSGILFDIIVQYDIEYIERQSLWFDLKILWWTFSHLFIGGGVG